MPFFFFFYIESNKVQCKVRQWIVNIGIIDKRWNCAVNLTLITKRVQEKKNVLTTRNRKKHITAHCVRQFMPQVKVNQWLKNTIRKNRSCYTSHTDTRRGKKKIKIMPFEWHSCWWDVELLSWCHSQCIRTCRETAARCGRDRRCSSSFAIPEI